MAIERFTDLTTTVDQLEGLRDWFEKTFPRIGRLATCKFCQTFWVSGVVGFLFPFPLLSDPAGWLAKSLVLWLSLFASALFLDEFLDRYLNRAPLDVFLRRQDAMDEEDSGP